ncbi:carboxypeptidase-like regulatory domain-containing protein [bacterium]|nr:carboxypeptidase-like regulatory domain-containing protein [bacterium]
MMEANVKHNLPLRRAHTTARMFGSLIVLLFTIAVFAPNTAVGRRIVLKLEGTVVDAVTGTPIPSARIEAIELPERERILAQKLITTDLYGKFSFSIRINNGTDIGLSIIAAGYESLILENPEWGQGDPWPVEYELTPVIEAPAHATIIYPRRVQHSVYEGVVPDFVLNPARVPYGNLEVSLADSTTGGMWSLKLNDQTHPIREDRTWWFEILVVDTYRLDFYRDDVWIAALDSVPVGAALTTRIALRPPRAGEDSVATYREIWHWVERGSGFVDEAWQESQSGERIDFSRRHFPLRRSFVGHLRVWWPCNPLTKRPRSVSGFISPYRDSDGILELLAYDAVSNERIQQAYFELPCHMQPSEEPYFRGLYSGLPPFTYRAIVTAEGYHPLGPVRIPVEAGKETTVTVTLYPDSVDADTWSTNDLADQVEIDICP